MALEFPVLAGQEIILASALASVLPSLASRRCAPPTLRVQLSIRRVALKWGEVLTSRAETGPAFRPYQATSAADPIFLLLEPNLPFLLAIYPVEAPTPQAPSDPVGSLICPEGPDQVAVSTGPIDLAKVTRPAPTGPLVLALETAQESTLAIRTGPPSTGNLASAIRATSTQ